VAWPDDGFGIKAEICGSLWQTKGIRSLITKNKKCVEFRTPTNARLYIIKYYSKMFALKHLKTLQHVSILFRSSSGRSYVPS